ncbi:hypothetical protein LZ30DRAFT_430242 [Colletotrichum cereale]|nr:hypothetical protein LZ30DRAFT_430242 [Colletotrichum cereale]
MRDSDPISIRGEVSYGWLKRRARSTLQSQSNKRSAARQSCFHLHHLVTWAPRNAPEITTRPMATFSFYFCIRSVHPYIPTDVEGWSPLQGKRLGSSLLKLRTTENYTELYKHVQAKTTDAATSARLSNFQTSSVLPPDGLDGWVNENAVLQRPGGISTSCNLDQVWQRACEMQRLLSSDQRRIVQIRTIEKQLHQGAY